MLGNFLYCYVVLNLFNKITRTNGTVFLFFFFFFFFFFFLTFAFLLIFLFHTNVKFERYVNTLNI